ncbi:hypothetical protein HanPSC8_Chr04g0164681 [Helianthus annuus]|nr:hypothetical protein HanPSC8_Chr04g0164681 [Helianthus annuus]
MSQSPASTSTSCSLHKTQISFFEVRIFIDLLKLHRSGEIVPESPERGADPVKSFLNRQRERERERERSREAGVLKCFEIVSETLM